MPGHVLTLPSPGAESRIQAFWSAADDIREAARQPFRGSALEAADRLDELLRLAVGEQMLADVPLGAFLSGGIDSSTIVAVMQALSPRPVKTFTIGFEDPAFNEASHAREVARHLGTDHTEWIITAEDALGVVPQLSTLYDEPFADSSQIPTLLVSRLARRHVTVSLSGDAGDELFGGYTRYALARTIWEKISWCPLPLRVLTSFALPPRQASLVRQPDQRHLYQDLIKHWSQPSIVIGASGAIDSPLDPHAWLRLDRIQHEMMHVDTVTYLPDDILVKVDRAAMATSLETRVPLLDPRIFQFAWSLPLEAKIGPRVAKLPLRNVLDRYVPRPLVERPKRGFAVPLSAWLRGPLREWGETLLAADRLRQEGYLEVSRVRQTWTDHVSGRRADPHGLWDVLMFQAWLETYR
jgi:asparagine synthase (glutamine-hydrolysing)